MTDGTATLRFAMATLTPVALLALAALQGGVWVWVALGYITLLVMLFDRLTAFEHDPGQPGEDFPTARVLSVFLGFAHFLLLALAVRALGGGHLSGITAVGAFLAFGMFFGQVSNSNAHELIHAADRTRRRLGRWVYISLMFGHHTSAHPLVHHVHVATDNDPNSARFGESYYRFLPRAWIGSFRAGLRAENARRTRASGPLPRHPYIDYVVGGLGLLALSFLLSGWGGVAAHLGLAFYATAQLMLSDYVQHYGLRRAPGPSGKPEPVGPKHSWNAPHWYSSAMMLNAPRHSDHHAAPGLPYPALSIDRQTMPMLPYSLPKMGAIALVPPLWRQVMDHRADAWRTRGIVPESSASSGPEHAPLAD